MPVLPTTAKSNTAKTIADILLVNPYENTIGAGTAEFGAGAGVVGAGAGGLGAGAHQRCGAVDVKLAKRRETRRLKQNLLKMAICYYSINESNSNLNPVKKRKRKDLRMEQGARDSLERWMGYIV